MINHIRSIIVYMTTIGERLCTERKAAGLTLQELGDKVGMTKAGISQLEHGVSKAPNPANLFKIADVLGVNPRWLVTGKGQRKGHSKKANEIADIYDYCNDESKTALNSTAELIKNSINYPA